MTADAGPGRDQTILVADDDPDLVTLVARRLRRAGYEVITASDGADALLLARENLPHLAVLDVMMPKLTGIEVMNQLRAGDRTRDIPIILISAGFKADLVDGDPQKAADDYVKKPFGPRELPERVEAVLARRTAS
jgi:two-component system phosphate regulon response regulator PhoB